MADATHISLKVKLDDDIRRFSVAKSINFVELHALISKHFVLAPESVQVKYIDDEEELITLGSDLELEEAKRLQPTVLRLNVYDSKPRRHTTDQPPSTPKLEAAFVRDVTVPDGTNVSARVKFQKSWCVKNTGSTAWPKGVVLKTVDPKDDQLLAFSAGAISRAVGPGEETVIGVDLQAPARPGRCVQHWRLFTEDGVAFGSRLWVDVTVGPSPQDSNAAAVEEEERELAEAEARRQAEQAELEQRLKEEDRLREELLLLEAEAMRRAAAEAEEAERQRLELERLLAEEERMKQQAEEEELRKREEEEVRRRLEEEHRRRKQEEDERRKQEEDERRKLEERKLEEEKRKLVEEEERRRKQEEEEENRKQEEEKRRLLNSKYPGQLTALAEMGFTNVEHNVKLLDKHKGSLDLALEALLSGH